MAAALFYCRQRTAAAQTLIARRAPIGSTIELVVNSTKAGSAQADSAGDAKIPFTLPTGKTEMDARVYVDTCGRDASRDRRGRDAAPIPPKPTARGRKSPASSWSARSARSSSTSATRWPPAARPGQPTVSALADRAGRRRAGSWSSAARHGQLHQRAGVRLHRRADVFGRRNRLGYTVGADYWVTRYVAIEGCYIRPPHLTIAGSGQAFHFDSFFEPHLFTVAGKVGVPLGPVRLYGRAGFNYHTRRVRHDAGH